MPRAGDAFLTGNLQLTHDPLARIDVKTSKPVFDLEAFVDSIRSMIEDYMIPIIKDLTGIDLSILMGLLEPAFALIEQISEALNGIELVAGAVLGAITDGIMSLFSGLGIDLGSVEQFFQSLATMIINGGIEVMGFVNAIVSFIVDALTGNVGGGLAELTAWAEDIPILGDIVHAITGVLGGGLPDLTSWAEGIPILGDIVHAITGILGGDLGSLTGWFTDLLGIFGDPIGLGTGTVSLGALESIPLLGPIFGFVQQLIDGILGLITGGLGTGNPLGSLFDVFGDFVNGLFGFGSAGSGLPIIGSGQVAAVPQNLLINGDFHDAAAFLSSSGIAWDGTQTHSGTGGSAKFTLTGVEKSLLSNGIDVVSGDKLDLVAWAKWSGLTGSGPISLMLNTYNSAGTLVSTTTIDSVASPGASGGWVQLDGQYTVPAGVAEVSARFNTAATLTAGTVWFDDASVKKPNTVPPAAVGGPLAGAGNLLDDITDLVDTIAGSFGGALTDIADRLADMLTPVSNLNGSNINTGSILDDFTNIPEVIGNIVTSFLGWDPGTYTHSQSAAAMSAQSEGLLNANAQLTQLQAYLASQPWTNTATGGGGGTTPTGVSATDDFERSGALGSNWINTNSAYQLDGHNAYWNATSFSALNADCQWQGTNPTSLTDYQISQVVIGNFAPTTSGSFYGWNHVDGRVGSGQRCRFSVRSDGYWEFSVFGAVYASGTGASLGIGSAMALLCGDRPSSTLNKFTCMINNSTIWTGTAASSTGTGFRGWGFGSGMNGTGFVGFGQVGYGGKVNQWYAADVV